MLDHLKCDLIPDFEKEWKKRSLTTTTTTTKEELPEECNGFWDFKANSFTLL